MIDEKWLTVTLTWKPISEAELWDKLNTAWDRMAPPQHRFWEAIRINPEKWQQSPWSDEGEGFWVVGVIGR